MNDVVVIGGGIVGLATAYQIRKKSPDVSITIVEKESEVAKHQTGNNSGVIHSGLYYKPGSLKAANCIKGYQLLLEFCDQENIRYELCGKIVVATSQTERPYLDTLYKRGEKNGLSGLIRLKAEELKEYEPHVNGIEGIYVPQTGIVDYKMVCLKLKEKLEAIGVEFYFGHKVESIKFSRGESLIKTNAQEFKTRLIVNCAGLYSDKVARMTPAKPDIKIVPFRGEYYQLKESSKHLVKNLIYPVPDPNFPFLGVHFTRMIHGGVEAGPNAVLAFAREGYKKRQINLAELFETLTWPGFQKVAWKYWQTGLGEMYRSFSKDAFTKALRKLIPEIQSSDLETGGAGIRAQACDRTGGLLDDFQIFEDDHCINVCNAPSPAATSSLAIGDEVSSHVLKRLC